MSRGQISQTDKSTVIKRVVVANKVKQPLKIANLKKVEMIKRDANLTGLTLDRSKNNVSDLSVT